MGNSVKNQWRARIERKRGQHTSVDRLTVQGKQRERNRGESNPDSDGTSEDGSPGGSELQCSYSSFQVARSDSTGNVTQGSAANRVCNVCSTTVATTNQRWRRSCPVRIRIIAERNFMDPHRLSRMSSSTAEVRTSTGSRASAKGRAQVPERKKHVCWEESPYSKCDKESCERNWTREVDHVCCMERSINKGADNKKLSEQEQPLVKVKEGPVETIVKAKDGPVKTNVKGRPEKTNEDRPVLDDRRMAAEDTRLSEGGIPKWDAVRLVTTVEDTNMLSEGGIPKWDVVRLVTIGGYQMEEANRLKMGGIPVHQWMVRLVEGGIPETQDTISTVKGGIPMTAEDRDVQRACRVTGQDKYDRSCKRKEERDEFPSGSSRCNRVMSHEATTNEEDQDERRYGADMDSGSNISAPEGLSSDWKAGRANQKQLEMPWKDLNGRLHPLRMRKDSIATWIPISDEWRISSPSQSTSRRTRRVSSRKSIHKDVDSQEEEKSSLRLTSDDSPKGDDQMKEVRSVKIEETFEKHKDVDDKINKRIEVVTSEAASGS